MPSTDETQYLGFANTIISQECPMWRENWAIIIDEEENMQGRFYVGAGGRAPRFTVAPKFKS